MNIALTLVFGLLSVSMQGEKEREGSFSGLIQDKALPNLEKPANVTPFDGTTFSYGLFASQKQWKAFANRAGKPVGKLKVDWKTEVVLYVVLQKHSNRLSFQKWKYSSDKSGEFLIQWRGIEPFYANSVPAVLHVVSRKNLQKVFVKFSGWGGKIGSLGTITLKP